MKRPAYLSFSVVLVLFILSLGIYQYTSHDFTGNVVGGTPKDSGKANGDGPASKPASGANTLVEYWKFSNTEIDLDIRVQEVSGDESDDSTHDFDLHPDDKADPPNSEGGVDGPLTNDGHYKVSKGGGHTKVHINFGTNSEENNKLDATVDIGPDGSATVTGSSDGTPNPDTSGTVTGTGTADDPFKLVTKYTKKDGDKTCDFTTTVTWSF